METVFYSHHWPEMAPIFIILFITLILFVVLMALIIKVLIFCKIFSKAGYCWALGLLVILPVIDIIMVFFLAFADWPISKEVRKLKQQQEKSNT